MEPHSLASLSLLLTWVRIDELLNLTPFFWRSPHCVSGVGCACQMKPCAPPGLSWLSGTSNSGQAGGLVQPHLFHQGREQPSQIRDPKVPQGFCQGLEKWVDSGHADGETEAQSLNTPKGRDTFQHLWSIHPSAWVMCGPWSSPHQSAARSPLVLTGFLPLFPALIPPCPGHPKNCFCAGLG